MYKYKPTNVVHERAFEGYDGLQLPRSPRTYQEGFASEFSDIDRRTKLYHFGFLATRGVDFYQDLRDNIDEKMADPRYHGYEDAARNAFVGYLEELCGEDDRYNHQSFEALYHLLVTELKVRYYEYEDCDSHEKCYAFK